MWVQNVKGGVQMFAYSPDGRTLYVSDSAGRVSEWDTVARTGGELFTLPSPTQWGMFCAADGRFLVVRNLVPLVWDCRERCEYASIDVAAIITYMGVNNQASQAAFSMRLVPGNDTQIFINRGPGLAMRVWDLTTRAFGLNPTWWPRIERLKRFDVSPDGRTVALVDDTHIRLADLYTGEWIAEIPVPENSDRVHFSPDGRMLVILTIQGVWFWSSTAGLVRVKGVRTATAKWATILKTFAFHPTEPLFVALNMDGLPTLFNRDTHQPLRVFDFTIGKQVLCAAFSPDGLTCAVGGSGKRFAVFDVDL